MKLSRKVFLTTALAALLGLGAAVGAHQAKAVKEVKAVDTTSVSLVGTFNSWNSSTNPLTLNGDWWTIEYAFSVDDQFKVKVNDNWDLTPAAHWEGIELIDGIIDGGGTDHNFKISTAGTYLVKAAKTIANYEKKGYGVRFEKVVPKVTVTKYAVLDGASPVKIEDEEINSGSSYAIPGKIFRSGYSFDGWYTDAACNTSYTARTVNANLDIYAKYTTVAHATGLIHVDLRDSGWTSTAGDYAVYFMDKTTYPSTIAEWSSYVEGIASGEHLVTIPYDIGFTPEEMIVVKYNASNTQQSWESNQWASKADQTVDLSFNAMVRIGNTKEGDNYKGYLGYPKIMGGDPWAEVTLLDSVKSNGSHNVEYYSESVTLAANQEFKVHFAPYADGDYYSNYTAYSSIEDNFEGGNGNNIKAKVAGTYAIYFDSTANTIYITDPIIAAADEWAQAFLSGGCTTESTGTKAKWGAHASSFAALDPAAQALFVAEEHISDPDADAGSFIASAVQRYDYVLVLYGVNNANTDAAGYQDFMGRVAANKVTPKQNARVSIFGTINDNNNALLIVGIVSLVAAFCVGGYFLFRKKKEN